jgi:hypothetical protein
VIVGVIEPSDEEEKTSKRLIIVGMGMAEDGKGYGTSYWLQSRREMRKMINHKGWS